MKTTQNKKIIKDFIKSIMSAAKKLLTGEVSLDNVDSYTKFRIEEMEDDKNDE